MHHVLPNQTLLFDARWYTKRATQFAPGFPRPGDLPDAPPMPPIDPLMTATAKAASAAAASVIGDASKLGSPRRAVSSAGVHRPPLVPSRGGTTLPSILDHSSGGVMQPSSSSPAGSRRSILSGAAPVSGTRTSSLRRSSGDLDLPPKQGSQSTGGLAESSANASIDEGAEPYRGGRCLCRLADPVMSLIELREMLEDMDVVPHLVTRQDVVEAFKAVVRASAYPYTFYSSQSLFSTVCQITAI